VGWNAKRVIASRHLRPRWLAKMGRKVLRGRRKRELAQREQGCSKQSVTCELKRNIKASKGAGEGEVGGVGG